MCILRTHKSHGVQPGNRVAQFVLASLAIYVHCQIRVPAQLLYFLGRQLGVVEQERDEALAHGVEVEDAAIGFLLDAGGDSVPIQYPLGM
jgi:hypothetical protein